MVVERVLASGVADLVDEVDGVARLGSTDEHSALDPVALGTELRAVLASQELVVPVLLCAARLVTDVVDGVHSPPSGEASNSHNSVLESTRSTSLRAVHTLLGAPVVVLVRGTRWVADTGDGINGVS